MKILEQVPLAPYTTLGVGGAAQYLVEITSAEELEDAQRFAVQHNLTPLVLGSGSNVLISDAGFAGLVIVNKITGRSYRETDTGIVISEIGAGESLDEIVADTVTRGYWGLENLSHIPGTIGATPVQNVGAYGVEVSQLITSVQAFNFVTGEHKTFDAIGCAFGYRDSYFKTEEGRGWIITQVTFELQQAPQPQLTYRDLIPLSEQPVVTQQEIRDSIIAIRSNKFPDWTVTGTAGSFFKNPVIPCEQAEALKQQYPDLPVYPVDDSMTKVSLGFILDQVCGLRGHYEGEVGLYQEQALVLVNTGDSATAVQQFADSVVQQVKDKAGITIEQEVRSV